MTKKSFITELENILLHVATVESSLEDLRSIDICQTPDYLRESLTRSLEEITLASVDLQVLLDTDYNDEVPLTFVTLLLEAYYRALISRTGFKLLLNLPPCPPPTTDTISCEYLAVFNSLQSNIQVIIHDLASILQSFSSHCECEERRHC